MRERYIEYLREICNQYEKRRYRLFNVMQVSGSANAPVLEWCSIEILLEVQVIA